MSAKATTDSVVWSPTWIVTVALKLFLKSFFPTIVSQIMLKLFLIVAIILKFSDSHCHCSLLLGLLVAILG